MTKLSLRILIKKNKMLILKSGNDRVLKSLMSGLTVFHVAGGFRLEELTPAPESLSKVCPPSFFFKKFSFSTVSLNKGRSGIYHTTPAQALSRVFGQ
jgi:hypothetical protein